MTTDFDKARKWRRIQIACAVAFLVVTLINIYRWATFSCRNSDNLLYSIVAFMMATAAWQCLKYSRCPHCGKWLMSSWLGRDGAGRNYIRRVAKGLPVICAHCGKEVETKCECDKTSSTRRKFSWPRVIAVSILAFVIGGSLVAAKVRLIARDEDERPMWEDAARERLSRDWSWSGCNVGVRRPVAAVKVDGTRLFSIERGHNVLAEVPCCSKCMGTDPDNQECEGHSLDRYGWVEIYMSNLGSFRSRWSKHGIVVRRWPAPREMTESEKEEVQSALAKRQEFLSRQREKQWNKDVEEK